MRLCALDRNQMLLESFSKRFSLVKIKAVENFNRRNTFTSFED
jgi:hypothetical protein